MPNANDQNTEAGILQEVDAILRNFKERELEPRAEAAHIEARRPTVIVGLGGSGGTVVGLLKQRLLESYGEIPKTIQFLVIDTAPTRMDSIEAREFVYIGGFDPDQWLEGLPLDDPVRRWWPEGLVIGQRVDDGAGQTRMVGRLALYHHFGAVRQAIERAIRESVEAMALLDDVEHVTGKAYVINSVAGGTGSGIFLEIALLLRHYFEEILGRPAFTTGMLVMPSAFKEVLPSNLQQRWTQANGYAALRELDFYMGRAAEMRREFPGGLVAVTERKPFDVCYVVSLLNMAGKKLRNHVSLFDMMAHQMMLELVTSLDENGRQAFDNAPVLGHRAQSKCLAYSSFAASATVFPHHRVGVYLACQFASDITGALRRDTVDSEAVRTDVDAFIDANRLREVDADQLIDRLRSAGEDGAFRLGFYVADFLELPHAELPDVVRQETDAWLSKKDEYLEEIEARTTEVIASTRGALREQLRRKLDAPSGGVAYTLHFVTQMAEEFDAYAQEMKTESSELEANRDSARRTRGENLRDLAEVADSFFFLRGGRIREVLEEYANSLREEVEAEVDSWLRMKAALVLGKIREELLTHAAHLRDFQQRMARIGERLGTVASRTLVEGRSRDNMFALSSSICGPEDLKTLYAQGALANDDLLAQLQERHPVSQLLAKTEADLAAALLERGLTQFRATYRMDLMAALKKLGKLDQLGVMVNGLHQRTAPFWTENPRKIGTLLANVEEIDLLGIPEAPPAAGSPWAKAEAVYPGQPHVAATGFSQRLVSMRTMHGLPLFAVREVAQCHRHFEDQMSILARAARENDETPRPLHVSAGYATTLPHVFPRSKNEALRLFARGVQHELIGRRGNHYHVVADDDASGIHEERELAQGRVPAFQAFERDIEVQAFVKRKIDQHMTENGTAVVEGEIREFLAKFEGEVKRAMREVTESGQLSKRAQQMDQEYKILQEILAELGGRS